MKNVAVLLWWAVLSAGGFYVAQWLYRVPSFPPIQSFHTGPTIQQVQQLSILVTSRIQTADVQETTVAGYTGGMKVALLVKGDFLLGVDLSQARFESVNPQAHTVVLVLPAPSVTSPRVDHSRTRLYQISSDGLWAMVPLDEGRSTVLERAFREAQQSVAAVAADPQLIATSRRQAEQVLATFFQALGWTLSIRWAA